MASKRPNQGEEVDGSAQKKTKTGEGVDLFETRVLIDNNEASVIIGKGGANVKKIREDSSAFVSILKSEGGKERVMQVKGTVEYNIKALQLIAELLQTSAKERNAAAETPEDGEEKSSFKILIHKALAGAIIGRGGEIIRNMQTETGARISLSTEPLGTSTEKTVSVTGTLEQLHACVTKILTQLFENPVKAGTTSVLYVPGGAPPQAAYGAPPQGAYGAPPPGYGGYPMAPEGYGMPPQGYGMPPQGFGAPPPAAGGAQKTEKIVIPTICAGTVIGKGGSIIRDIKTQSGCQVSLAAPEPTTPDDRVVSITGSAQGIQTAIYLIRQRVESYQVPSGAPAM